MKFNSQLTELSNRRSTLIMKIMRNETLNISEQNELDTINKKIMGIYKREGVKFPTER